MLDMGYIEGYYGRLLSWQSRSTLLKFLSHLDMNLYIYGPKEDPYNRIKWFELYPDEELENFKRFKEEASSLGITVYFSLSPGMSQDQEGTSNLESLKNKFNQLQSVGFSDFGIFFDDLESEKDANLGREHGYILTEMSKYLDKSSTSPLLFCPTVYCNSIANNDISNSSYLKALDETIPSNLSMLWTGKAVVSQSIDNKEIKELQKIISNPVLIWDNYYANDYCPSKFYIGPLKERHISKEFIEGIGLNLTGLPITDCFILAQSRGDLTTEEILKKFKVPEAFKVLIPFFNGPFDKLPDLESVDDIQNLINLSKELCVEWKSPLQLEWSPFLWDFFNHLNFLKKIIIGNDKKTLEAWALRRYSGPLAKIITSKLKKKGS